MIDLQMMFMEYRISMIFLLIFQLLFLHLRYKKWISGAIALGCFGITGVMEYLIFFKDLNLRQELFLTVLEIVVVQATAYILCCYRDGRTLFTGISSATYVLIGNVFYMGLTAFWGPAVKFLLMSALVHLLLLLIITISLRSSYLSVMDHYSKLWNKLCLIPALFYTVTYMLTSWPGDLYKNRENWLAILLIMFLMEATYVLIIKLTSQQYMETEVERSKEFLETYAAGLQREAEILRSSEEKIQVLRHDTRHIYQVILIYLEEGRTEQIRELLDQLDEEVPSLSDGRFCENVTLNGVLSGWEAKARKEKVDFICHVDVPKVLQSVNEFELATVISNLLENAVYAAKKVGEQGERRVEIQIFPVKGQLILEITNTFSGACEFSSVTGLPLSAKGDDHGYGLRSVKAYANKHHAIFRYSVENGLFCVRLLTDI